MSLRLWDELIVLRLTDVESFGQRRPRRKFRRKSTTSTTTTMMMMVRMSST
jgi:hypothetical protein